jgi:hypothetical protein
MAKLKDIITSEIIGFCEYSKGKERSDRAMKVYEQAKDKNIEDLTIKEIKGLAPLTVQSQEHFFRRGEDKKIIASLTGLLWLEKKHKITN